MRSSWRGAFLSRVRQAGRTLVRAGDRGATAVEYGLLVAGMVVVSIAALQSLTDSSRDEVANEMDCVSSRPPPPSCQVRAVSTTTTDPTATTSTSLPTSTLPPTVMTWTGLATAIDSDSWKADATIVLTNQGAPVVGATVTIRVSITAPQIPVTYEITCVTDGAGQCSVSFTVPEDLGVLVTGIRFSVLDVSSPEPVDNPPGDLNYTQP